jgi:putative SOS response-associated peptidase YedK
MGCGTEEQSGRRRARAVRLPDAEANAIVAPVYPKAMPAILTTPEEVDLWLAGETIAALKLQRPLPDDALKIVARGEKEDPAPAIVGA